jgi:hypothetical protein
MSVRYRTATAGALAAALAVAAPTLAHASPQRAEALNAEGRELFSAEDYAAAADRFHQAIEVSPEARFYFNLCFTYYMLGELDAALDACDEVRRPAADDDLIGKRDHVLGLVHEELEERAASQPDPADPTYTPGEGSAGQPAGYDRGGQPPAERRPPRLHDEPEIPHDYNWSLGFSAGGVRNIGVGDGNYEKGTGQLRLMADFILSPQNRFGVQAYADFTRFERTNTASPVVQSLTAIDLGGAIFQHLPLLNNVYFTPLAGAHFAILQPDQSDVGFGTVGARGEATFNLVFGASDQHAISLTPLSLNLYLPASSGASNISAAEYGLNRPSATFAVTVGYTLRFAEPFGGSLITLE